MNSPLLSTDKTTGFTVRCKRIALWRARSFLAFLCTLAGFAAPLASANPDLAVSITSAPNPASAGNNLVYTVAVTNLGSTTAHGVILTNMLSPGQTIAGSTTTCPDPGPLAWWKGEGDALDSVNANHGTLMNGATFDSAGRVGQAFSLDGTDDFVSFPDAAGLHPASFTIEGWFKPATDAGIQVLVSKTVGSSDSDSFALLVFNGQAGILVGDSTGIGPVTFSSSLLTPGQWFHLAFTFDGSGINHSQTLYINGVFAVSETTAKSVGYDSNPVVIGMDIENGNPNFFYPGLADEVAFYDRVLSLADIQGIFNAGSAGKCSSPTRMVLGDLTAGAGTSVAVTTLVTACSGTISNVAAVTTTDTEPNLNNNMFTNALTVLDSTGPVLSDCPADIQVSANMGECDQTVNWTDPTALDACAGTVAVVCSPASGSVFAVGETVVTCTASDGLNTSDCTFTVTVTDGDAPVISGCPTGPMSGTDAGLCTAVVTWTAPTALDACVGSVSVDCTPASGSTFPLGMTTVTCTATDGANEATCSFQVSVLDDDAPVIAGCSAGISVGTDAGQCNAVVTWTAPTALDSCVGPVSVVCNPLSGSTFSVGPTTVSCSATDGVNISGCQFTVTVTDDDAPVITGCPSPIVMAAGAGLCTTTVNWMSPTAQDACAGTVSVNCTPASGSSFTVGITLVNCTATDGVNVAPCSFNVTVTDNEAPVISSCPSPINLGTIAGQCSAVATWTAPTAMDVCAGAVSVNCVPASGSTFNVGMTTVTCSATDGGNVATCSFNVTVTDDDAPVIVGCPGNIMQGTGLAFCSAVVTWPAPTGNDACAGTVTVNCNPTSGSTFPTGSTSVNCTASDGVNVATCSFNVTVTDDDAPVISGCPANTTVSTTVGQCTATASWVAPTASDVCVGSVAVNCSPSSGSAFSVGTTLVNCTATDGVNVGSCSFNVTVMDGDVPVISGCPAPIVITADSGDCSATVTWMPMTAMDTCAGSVPVNCTPASGSSFVVGTTSVTCSATDGANVATCTFSVTVQDMQNPTVTCPSDITTTETVTGSGPVAVNFTATGSDNCSGATTVCVPASGSLFPVGTTQVTCTTTDASMNTDECTFNVTVNPGPAIPVADLGLWLRADVGTITSGSVVTQWNDQSGNNRHATQAGGQNQPALSMATLNGMPVVRFDGTNDFLTFNLPVTGLTGMTLFLVANNSQNQIVGPTRAERAALFWNEATAWGTVYLTPFQSQVAFRFGTTQAGNQPLFSRPAAIGTGFTISTALKNGTTDTLFVNGTQVLSQGGKLATIAGVQPTGNLGRGFNNNTFFAGDIAEVLVYTNALTPMARAAVEAYLDGKYGITAPPVPQAPSIQVSPANLTVNEPSPATFSVSASGATPLSYQWRRGGVDIGGATSASYTLTPTSQAGDNGAQFDVVITNMVGSVTSVVATLTVVPPGTLPSNGLGLWLRADLGTTTSGPVITQWNDQSGNNRHATQASSISQPTLLPTGLNGLPVIRFDGINDFLNFTFPVNGLTGMSIFLVAANNQNQLPGITQAERAAIFWNETSSWGTVYLSPYQAQVPFRFGTGQANNQPLYVRPVSIGTDFSLTTAIKDGTTDTLYINGSQVLSQGGKLGTIASCQSAGNVGRGHNNNTFYNGDIAEVLVYTKALTPADRALVENYLDTKYGLTAPPPPQGPVIQVHPASRTVAEPAGVTFNVVANGTAPLAYQWRRSGIDLTGETNASYTLNPTSQAGDNGAQFDVVVTNSFGSVTSSVAVLTMVASGTFPSANLGLWLRADAGTVTTGSAVTQWSDQSGNGNHAAQGAVVSQPLLTPSILNGLPVVRFDGANDFLTFTFPLNGLSGMTIFMVAANRVPQVPGVTQAERAALFWGESTPWGTVYLSPFQTQVPFRFGTTQAGNQPLYMRPASVSDGFTFTTALKNGPTDSLYVNGALVLTQGGKLSTLAGVQPTGNIGRGFNNNTFFNGDIAEVLVYTNALNATDRALVESYLNNKYAITAPVLIGGEGGAASLLSGVSLRAERGADDAVVLSLEGSAGTSCIVERSDDLIHWTPVTTVVLPAGVPAIATLTVPNAGTSGYFRARVD